MTIAELLVQTTATLVASGTGLDDVAVDRVQAVIDGCVRQARAIVAAIYGQPCDEPMLRGPYSDTTVSWKPDRIVPSPAGLPGDECARCKWPRSQHGARP